MRDIRHRDNRRNFGQVVNQPLHRVHHEKCGRKERAGTQI